MEDAIKFNKASIERGIARSTFYRIYEADAVQYSVTHRQITVPEAGTRGYRGDNTTFTGTDHHQLESQVVGGDVLIGRISPARVLEEYKNSNQSTKHADTSVDMPK
jgi:DNA-directed RNA polymerase subunit B